MLFETFSDFNLILKSTVTVVFSTTQATRLAGSKMYSVQAGPACLTFRAHV